jgi:hypothetical protein
MVLLYMASSIAGVVLFVYLCRTRQLVISRDIFFLLPHILLYFGFASCINGSFLALPEKWTGSFYDVIDVAYIIVEFGLPFLLYCFLQVPGDAYEIISRIFCFILPVLSLLSIASAMR